MCPNDAIRASAGGIDAPKCDDGFPRHCGNSRRFHFLGDRLRLRLHD